MAERWRIPPWEVDWASAAEIEAELRMARIEAEVSAGLARMRGGQG